MHVCIGVEAPPPRRRGGIRAGDGTETKPFKRWSVRKKTSLKKSEPRKGQTSSQNDISTSAHISATTESFAGNSSRVDKSLNSNYIQALNANERKVQKTVEESPIPITPLKISQKTGINHNYVKTIIRKLERLGFIRKRFYGHYESVKNVTTLGGVGLEEFKDGGLPPVRCHKLMFTVGGVRDVVLGRSVIVDNDLFRVVFVGYPNQVVNVFVDCKGSYSFDYGAFRLLVELVKAKLGVKDEDAIEVSTFELNEDYKGIQLDGVKALTLKAFSGEFERLYNKDGYTLRSEVNLQKPLSVEAAYSLLKGGITPYNIFQSNFMLVQKVEGLVEVVKFGNRTMAQILRLLLEERKRKEQREADSNGRSKLSTSCTIK